MNYFSTFSGIGGFEIGILGAMGHAKCVGYSEIDKFALQIYQKHFPDHKNYGDITKIDTKELPEFDLLVGGFPCQSFSIAGKRQGFRDTRGTLFFEIARIIKAKRPRILLLENVKGLLSHDNGQTFATIIRTLDELGYDLQWQVLNSKNHRVPQNRERVYIVGHLRGTPRPEVFPIRGTNAKDIEQINNPIHSNDRVYGVGGIAPTLNTMQGGNRQPFILQKSQDWREKGKLRKFEKHSPTLRANMGDNQPIVSTMHGTRIRRLTPTECERLQAYPDGWTDGVSDTQRYKVLGNGVTTSVIEDIMMRIKEVF